MNLNRFENSGILAKQLADDVARRLQRRIDEKGRACLAVSGGKTPIGFFRALAQQDIPWSRILITLVDERWVSDTDPVSNAALVREYLLCGKASAAYFLPLWNQAATPAAGFMECENRLHEQILRMDIAVLGMGLDGHTASWFPESTALPSCLDESGAAWCCPVSDVHVTPPRMTLTWSCLRQCQHLFLHIEGEDKNQVFRDATSQTGPGHWSAMPVRRLLAQKDVPLSVFCTE